MRRPLLLPLLCLAGGILTEWWGRFELSGLWPATVAVFVWAVVWERGRAQTLPVLVFLLGALSTGLQVMPFSPADLRLVAGNHPVLATVKGRLAAAPELKRGTREGESDPLWRVLLDCEALEQAGRERVARGRVMVFSRGAVYRRLRKGARVAVFGVLSQPSRAPAVGLFDYREKLRRDGIHYQLLTQVESDWRMIEASDKPDRAARFRDWAVGRLRTGLPADESVRLLAAMILGLRTGLTDEVAAPFMRSGTMHIFAISGLHVAMVAGILIAMLRVGRVPRGWCGLIVIPALWFYCHVTGWQASATRATIMMTVVLLGWALRRPADLLNSVCAAGVVILLWEPLQLLQTSFQLSFAVVGTIALVWPRLDEWGERLFAQDPFLPGELEAWWHRQVRRAGRWAYSLLAISLAAWLGSMPLIACYFHLWTPGSLLANPPVVLLTMCAIGSAMGGLLGSLLWPWAGEVFGNGAWFWITCQARISEAVAGLPLGWRFVSAPSSVEVAIYYATLIAWATRWFNRRRIIVAAALGVGLLVARWNDGRSTDITIFGESANAVLCDLPGSENDLLIDCGRSNAVERVVIPYARSRGMRRVETLLLSHGDAGHVAGSTPVMRELRPKVVAISGVEQRSDVYRRAATNATSRVTSGDRLGPWTVLHPPVVAGVATADDVAVSLRGEIEGLWVLILPDASEAAQRAIMDRWERLDAEILIVGCPREGEAILDEFLRRVGPKQILLQDNRTPAYDRASGELLRRLGRGMCSVHAVSRKGAATLRLRGGKAEVFTMAP